VRATHLEIIFIGELEAVGQPQFELLGEEVDVFIVSANRSLVVQVNIEESGRNDIDFVTVRRMDMWAMLI
jgi:hypothetical protein